MAHVPLHRLALAVLVAVTAVRGAAPASPDFRAVDWRLDPRPVLTRGGEETIDRAVVGDPCVVWDESAATWRMFYFASGLDPHTGARGPRTAMALASSVERIEPGDWRKEGLVRFANGEALLNPNDYHKWWVVMDPLRPNHAVTLEGRYWAIFTASIQLADGRMHKHLQAASAESLAGPWTVRPGSIVAPGAASALDGLHADTPTAFWFADRRRIAIFYKAYPIEAQAGQPASPFGSGTMLATWYPTEPHALKVRVVLRSGRSEAWNQGWMSSVQLLPPVHGQWYGLGNASPTAPADLSHREPAPPLGGWFVCDGDPLAAEWRADPERPPLRRPEQLTPAELAAGLGVNFWRHHLLVTPAGQMRIFFNSGAYGHEQMYSLVGR